MDSVYNLFDSNHIILLVKLYAKLIKFNMGFFFINIVSDCFNVNLLLYKFKISLIKI